MARITQQGEDYEEDATEEEYDGESGEDTEAKLTSIAGIPIKFVVIGGVVMLLTLLIVIVFSLRGKGGDADIYVPPVDSQGQQQSPLQSGDFTWLLADGTVFGTTTSTADWTDIYNNGVAVGCIAPGGDVTLTSTSGVTATAVSYGTTTTPEQSTEQPVTQTGDNSTTASTSSGDDIEMLRKLGYTGDEIELAISTGMDLQAMIEAAQQLRDSEALEAIQRMSDFLSPEFQHIYTNSIFFMPEQTFPEQGDTSTKWDISDSYLVNADYEKMDTFGYQLWIKVKIANDTYAFMIVDPIRWETMPSSGNIVVRVNYKLYGNEETNVGFYITSMVEQDITQLTVNPEDSGVDLESIINR